MKITDQGDLTSVQGIKACGIHCGIKPKGKDLALIYSVCPAIAAGVYTRNSFIAAPLLVTKEHLRDHRAQAIVVNSGNANAATGERGIEDARRMAILTAQAINIPKEHVIVASTGVIGKYLPMEKIASGIKEASSILSVDGGKAAAEAIMTTDTFPKTVAVDFEIAEVPVRLAGMAKGAGMIRPNMATMLAFLTTDADLDGGCLQELLINVTEQTFNRITIDGDTSTNDMVVILANGLSGARRIGTRQEDIEAFGSALENVCQKLAQMIVSDGEGATKSVCITVTGSYTKIEAKRIAFRIAESPLVKTAIYGRSCNWGRIMAAVGSLAISIKPEETDIYYGPVQVVKGGVGTGPEREKEAESLLQSRDVHIRVELHRGHGSFSVWTTDLSPKYVTINANYMT